MQDLFPLFIGALFVYFLFFRKGGMGMGCCGGHGGHGREPDENRQLHTFPEDKKEDVIDLREDQYTVLSVEEDQQLKTIERPSKSKTH